MARVKTARTTRARHKKILKQAKGYFGAKHYRFRNANQAVMKSLSYAYVGRKDKKSDFRKLWITRINAACRENEISYSKFIDGLNKASIAVNRKMLSELAIDNPQGFSELVKIAKDALDGKKYEPKTAKAVKTEKTTKEEKTSKEEKVVKEKKETKTTAKKAPAKKTTSTATKTKTETKKTVKEEK